MCFSFHSLIQKKKQFLSHPDIITIFKLDSEKKTFHNKQNNCKKKCYQVYQ